MQYQSVDVNGSGFPTIYDWVNSQAVEKQIDDADNGKNQKKPKHTRQKLKNGLVISQYAVKMEDHDDHS